MDDLLWKISVFLDHYAATHPQVRTRTTDRINRAALAREMHVHKSTVSRLLRRIRNAKDGAHKPYSFEPETASGLMRLANAGSMAQLHATLDRTFEQLHAIQGGKKRRR